MTKGVYFWDGTNWVRTEASEVVAGAFNDVAVLCATSGTPGDYVGTANASGVLNIQAAWIDYLRTHDVKITTGGNIRGGDRYDANGATIDGTVAGFWIGASGACKLAGVTFEGSQAGGVQWGLPVLIGEQLTISGITGPAVTPLDGNTIAVFNSNTDRISNYKFNGLSWRADGGYMPITSGSAGAITTLAENRIAFYDTGSDTLRYLQYDTDAELYIAEVPNLTISGTGIPAITALNSTDIAFIDSTAKTLQTYRHISASGTWITVGTGLTISGLGYPAIATLSSTDIVLTDSDKKILQTYRFSGTTWSGIGNAFTLPTGISNPIITALNGTDIVFIDSTYDQLWMYRFDGVDWAKVSSTGATSAFTSDATITALNGTDIVLIDDGTKKLSFYRYSYALSSPYSRYLID